MSNKTYKDFPYIPVQCPDGFRKIWIPGVGVFRYKGSYPSKLQFGDPWKGWIRVKEIRTKFPLDFL